MRTQRYTIIICDIAAHLALYQKKIVSHSEGFEGISFLQGANVKLN